MYRDPVILLDYNHTYHRPYKVLTSDGRIGWICYDAGESLTEFVSE